MHYLIRKCSEAVTEYFRIHGHPWTGRSHTEETKRKIGMANAKQVGDKNGRFGTCWITNGIESKTIQKTDDIPEGWRRGRVVKNGKV